MGHKESTFVEHLEELRSRIVISLAFFVIFSAAAFPYAPKLLAVLKAPSAGVIEKLVFFSPAEAFLAHVKIALSCGLILSMPIILYELWVFVSPAIEAKAKSIGSIFFAASVGAFVSGGAFGFFILLPASLKFLIGFSGDSLEPLISVSSYISFALGMVLCSGLVFEMPVLSFLLSRIGVINHRLMRKVWKYAVVAIFIAAAIITPTPDIFNMIILAVPMLFLYELSIWVSRFAAAKRAEITL